MEMGRGRVAGAETVAAEDEEGADFRFWTFGFGQEVLFLKKLMSTSAWTA